MDRKVFEDIVVAFLVHSGGTARDGAMFYKSMIKQEFVTGHRNLKTIRCSIAGSSKGILLTENLYASLVGNFFE